jgi:hypothetical protein
MEGISLGAGDDALGIEWNWRVLTLCILSSFLDAIIYSGRGHAATDGARQDG